MHELTNPTLKDREDSRSTMRARAISAQERLFPRTEYRVHRLGNDHPLGSAENPISGGTIVPTLCDVVLETRASINGSADPWPDDCLKEVAEMLVFRLQMWDTNPGGIESQIIDTCVNQMCRACIDMIGAELKDRQERGHVYPRRPGDVSYPGIERDERNAADSSSDEQGKRYR